MAKIKKLTCLVSLCFVLLFSFACSADFEEIYDIFGTADSVTSLEEGSTLVEAVDVGQADCFLISNESFGNILIDTGDTEHSEDLVDYLKKKDVDYIDYIILTHPHSDHIGGMSEILDNFEVKNIYMPKMTHNTATFRKVTGKMRENNLRFKEAKSGVKIALREGSSIEFLSPTKDMSLKDLDNSDAVCMLKTNGKKVLFTADIFKETELRLIHRTGKIDILKVAHHGSHKSTCSELLLATRPTYAMIGVGENNKYDHPSEETLKRLDKFGVEVYRTDLDGNISFVISNEGNIEVNTSR